MKITVSSSAAASVKADLLTIPLAEVDASKGAARTKTKSPARPRLTRDVAALDRALGGLITTALRSGDFTGQTGQRLILYPAQGAKQRRIALLGLGKTDQIDAERLRRVGASSVSAPGGGAAKGSASKRLERVAILAPRVPGIDPTSCAARLAEGAVLGAYHFDAYIGAHERKSAAPKSVGIVFEKLDAPTATRRSVAEAVIAAESQNVARDLSNEPPNELPPSGLAAYARRMSRQVGLRCRVLRVAELERRGLTALLAVGRGSVHPPQLIVMEHPGESASGRGRKKGGTICLVGKGITFDSGGLSLKPAANMGDMKHDMSGAAAVMGAMRAIALQKLAVHVVGIVAAAENMPSGCAYRPGDIIGSMAGKTIEITNTDAEGRVVLADALHYACQEFEPEVMIDVATLTGAAMVAFGPWATAALGNDDEVLAALGKAGDAAGERVWPMPLLPEHGQMMKSSVADLKNSGGREAGISTAGAFLSAFVGTTPWVHLDIAGSGWTSTKTPYHRGGATGVGVRLLVEWIRNRMVQPG